MHDPHDHFLASVAAVVRNGAILVSLGEWCRVHIDGTRAGRPRSAELTADSDVPPARQPQRDAQPSPVRRTVKPGTP
jgi:hypothetical protein